MVGEFYEGLGLGFDRPEQTKRELLESEVSRLYSVASFASRARSGTTRDAYTREVVDVPQPEVPTRLAQVFGQLYLGMEIIGVGEQDRWKLVGKVALDSMPNIRRRTMELTRRVMVMGSGNGNGGNGGVTPGMVSEGTGVSGNTARRAIEDLKIHQMLRQVGTSGVYRMTDWAEEHYEKGWRGVGL